MDTCKKKVKIKKISVGDLIQYYKVSNGLGKIRWSKEHRILRQDNKLNPARNLIRTDLTVYKESVSKVRAREEFFLNRVAPIWNNSQ